MLSGEIAKVVGAARDTGLDIPNNDVEVDERRLGGVCTFAMLSWGLDEV